MRESISQVENIENEELSPEDKAEIDKEIPLLGFEKSPDESRFKIEEIKKRLDEISTPVGNIEHTGEQEPIYFYSTHYDRMHGSEKEIHDECFGRGWMGLFKFMFNFKAHRKFHKMMKEYADDSLATITRTKELAGYRPSNRAKIEK